MRVARVEPASCGDRIRVTRCPPKYLQAGAGPVVKLDRVVDLRVDGIVLEGIADRVRSARTSPAWDRHGIGYDVLGSEGVAEAAFRVTSLARARCEVLAGVVDKVAAFPREADMTFEASDRSLAMDLR